MLVPPTWVTLHHLAAMESVAQALEQQQARRARSSTRPSSAARALDSTRRQRPASPLWAGDEAYPGSRAPAGARHRLTTSGPALGF